VRTLFIALLVVNITYFAWASWVDVPRAPPVNELLAKLPRLKLVSEVPGKERPVANTRTTLNETPACMSVGPFGDITNAAKAAGILMSKGFAPQQRAAEAGMSAGYWVYVAGLKSDIEADKVRVSLEQSGIKDALVMPSGADAGRRLSLGLFSDRAHAEQRAAAVRRMGLKAEIAEHKMPQVVYWIDLAPRAGMTSVPIADLFAEGLGSRIVVQPCPPPTPPSTTAGAQSAGAPPAAQPAPPSAAAPRYPVPAAPPAPTEAGPPATHVAATPKPADSATPR
jgi:hypothetical protein